MLASETIMVQESTVSPVAGSRHLSHRPAKARSGEPSEVVSAARLFSSQAGQCYH